MRKQYLFTALTSILNLTSFKNYKKLYVKHDKMVTKYIYSLLKMYEMVLSHPVVKNYKGLVTISLTDHYIYYEGDTWVYNYNLNTESYDEIIKDAEDRIFNKPIIKKYDMDVEVIKFDFYLKVNLSEIIKTKEYVKKNY